MWAMFCKDYGSFINSLSPICHMATITKRGKKWAVRIRTKNISLSQSFVTKTQAQAWATQTESAILSGQYEAGSEKTLADAMARYLAEVTPKKKSARIESVILQALMRLEIAQYKLSKLTPELFSQYRDTELQRIKAPSVLRYMSLMGSVLEVAVNEWQWIRDNPIKRIKKPSQGQSRMRVFTLDEIERFSVLMGRDSANSAVQQTILDCFLFAIETGMRAGEIRGLEWSMINGRVAELSDTKNGDARRVPLTIKAVEILDSRRKFDKPFLVKRGTLSAMFTRYCLQAGIEAACFHDTRHTAITRLAKVLTPFELARMAGHRNLSQTLAYFNESAESLVLKLDG